MEKIILQKKEDKNTDFSRSSKNPEKNHSGTRDAGGVVDRDQSQREQPAHCWQNSSQRMWRP